MFLNLVLISCVHLASSQYATTNLASAINDFAFQFYQTLPRDGNLVFSPMSISTALAMTYLGTKGNTSKQMETVLGMAKQNLTNVKVHDAYKAILSARNSSEYQLNIANCAVIKTGQKVLRQFVEQLEQYYGADFIEADFSQRPEEVQKWINQWVSNNTGQKIPHLLSEPPSSLTQFFLINAVYFHGLWKTKFNTNSTLMLPFYSDDGSENLVPMMILPTTNLYHAYVTEIDADVVELPYVGGHVSCVLIIPRLDENALFPVDQYLNASLFSQLLNTLKPQVTDFAMPRFNISWGSDLRSFLMKLGMRDLFLGGQADLSGITGAQDLYVSKVIHRSTLEVNEEGSRASASTVVVGTKRINSRYPIVANHPYLFFIVDKNTGTILFMSRVARLP